MRVSIRRGTYAFVFADRSLDDDHRRPRAGKDRLEACHPWRRRRDRAGPADGRAGEGNPRGARSGASDRSEEHTSELQSLMRTSYAVFCLKKKHTTIHTTN